MSPPHGDISVCFLQALPTKGACKKHCKKYKEAHGIYPDIDKLHEYFFLFTNDRSKLTPTLNEKLKLCGNYDQSVVMLENHKPLYQSYEKFLEDL